MKTSKFTDSQVMEALKRVEAGLSVPEICRELTCANSVLPRYIPAPGWQNPERYRKRLFPIQVGDTPNRPERRISIGFQADTP